MKNRIKKSNVEEIVDLNMTQKGMLFHYLKDGDQNNFNIQMVFVLNGLLDIESLKKSIFYVKSRNEVLRSIFTWENINNPVQIILKDFSPEISFRNFSLLGNREAEVHFEQYLDRDRKRRFDLDKGAIRFGLIKFSDQQSYLSITHHHILYDGWSTAILIDELLTCYEAFTQNKEPALGNKPMYKEILKGYRSTIWDREVQAFWSAYLQGYEISNVSPGIPDPDEQKGIKKLSVQRNLDLEAFANRYQVTKASIIYAAYAVLLQKYLYTSDIVFGTAVSFRGNTAKNDEKVMGNFINSIPLRIKEGENKTLREIVQGIHRDLIERNAYNHSSYFEIKQLQGLGPDEYLFDSVIAIENYPVNNRGEKGVGEIQLELHSVYENANIPLYISVFLEEELKIEFNFQTNSFSEVIVKTLANHLLSLIHEIISNPDNTSKSSNLMSDSESLEFVRKNNDTTSDFPINRTVVGLFEEQVGKTPDKCAVFTKSGQLTYYELNSQINRLAHFFLNNGITKGEVVGILMDRSIDFIICAIAIIKAGGKYLPLDLGNPKERISYMLEDCEATYLISNNVISGIRELIPSGTAFCFDEIQTELENCPSSNPQQKESDDLYVMYTSGSTGVPKGVNGSQRGLLNRLFWGWENYPIIDNEVFCLKTNIGFVDHVVEMFSPLLSGIPLRIISEVELLDIQTMYEILIKDKITRITVVPSYLKAFLDAQGEGKLSQHSLRYVFCSGEYLSFSLAKNFYEEFSNTQLVNIYGSTEVSADATYYNVERYFVEDVLKYFKRISHIPNSLSFSQISDEKLGNDVITLPHIRLPELAENFCHFTLSDFPISLESYYKDLQKRVLPYAVNTASPRFIGHMTSVLPDYVHDFSKLLSELNQNLVKIETSKSLTFLERESIAILHKIFYSLSDNFYLEHTQKLNSNLGIITTGGSTANMSALLSSRNKLLYEGFSNSLPQKSIYQQLRSKGYNDLVIIGSRLMHYSFRKAVSMLGLGLDNILYIENDAKGKVDLEDLRDKIAYCKSHNLLIVAIIGIAGATETGVIDPLDEMARIAEINGIHFHVDAAWGGLLKFSDEYSRLLEGIERADSITFCGHKQLFLPQGISICLFKDPYQLHYNSTEANYQASSGSYDFGRFTLEGSRSGLSLCLHASLNILGRKGYALLLERGINLANTFADLIREADGLELISVNINIVNYRYIPLKYRKKKDQGFTPVENEEINDVNVQIQQTQFLKGQTFVSKTKIRRNNDPYIVVFRAVLSNPLTTKRDLEYVLRDQFLIIEELFGEKNEWGNTVLIDEIASEGEEESNKGREIRRIPIGKPIANTQIFILNRDNELQSPGYIGEIVISGLGVTPGYTQHTNWDPFTSDNPLLKGLSLHRTGDLGRWLPDGNIEFWGRLDDQVKINGNRIEPTEIASRMNEHESIHLCAVRVLEQTNSKQIVAFYESERELDKSELREFLSSTLPKYMIPSQFTWVEKIPMLKNGKLDVKSLPSITPVLNSNYVAPTRETEKRLIELWLNVLSLGKDTFGVQTSFFDVGGDSLKAVILSNKISKNFKVKISINDIFNYPEVGQMSKLIEAKVWAVSDPKITDKPKSKVVI